MRSKRYDILIVDDDADDRMIIGEAFAALACEERVTMYDSSFAFHQDLTNLRNLLPLPKLIVLDYNLPGADGAVVLSLLKNDTLLQQIPVVMYSTGISPTQREDCLAKGAVECFVKGTTFDEVLAFVKQLCETAIGRHRFA